MLKTTVSGSFFAKLFPNASKWLLENASQDIVNAAEQEAAVVHQQMQAGTQTTPPAPAAPAAVVTPAAPAALDTTAPAPTAAELTSQLTAMSTRATTAENQVASLTTQLTAANQDRDRYKAWHDKHKTVATALPGSDTANKDDAQQDAELSTASASALAQFRRAKGIS